MANKAKLIEALEYSQQELRSFVEALGDEQRSAIGTEDRWSAKDVVAHITEWVARRVSEIGHATQSADRPPGALPDDDDLDNTNAEIYAQYQNVSWEQILTKMEHSFAAIIAFTRAATPVELDDTRRIPWIAERPFWRILVGNAVEHPILHLGYYHIENGNSADAVRLQEACVPHLLELDDSPAWRGAQMYNLACIQALSGRKDDALGNLAEAFRLAPELVEWSKQDPDLTGLRQDPAFQALYAV